MLYFQYRNCGVRNRANLAARYPIPLLLVLSERVLGKERKVKGYSSRNAGAIYARGPTSEPKIQNKLSFLRGSLALLLTRGLGPDRQECRRSQSSVSFGCVFVLSLIVEFALVAGPAPARAQSATWAENSKAVYKQANAPIERRIDDLVRRMTLEEKVRQLDLYSGATALVDQHTDGTHAATTANFLPDKAQALFGDLGVGAIHDLNPTPEQANAIQQWVIKHNRLGIPVLFIEEALHGFDTGTVFPAPINLASTWDPAADRELARPLRRKHVQPVWA